MCLLFCTVKDLTNFNSENTYNLLFFVIKTSSLAALMLLSSTLNKKLRLLYLVDKLLKHEIKSIFKEISFLDIIHMIRNFLNSIEMQQFCALEKLNAIGNCYKFIYC